MKRWAVSTILVLFFSGCIQSDLSNCPSEVVIDFEYVYNMQEVDLIDKEISDISLFIFDHNDKFVMRIDKELTASDHVMTFDLNQGIYQFVAWGNLNEHYEEIQLEPKVSESKDLIVTLKNDTFILQEPQSLFHAQLIAEKVERLGLKKKMSLIKNSNTIEVTLNYPKTEASRNIRNTNNTTGNFSLSSTNGVMDASNQMLLESGLRSYHALSATDTELEDNMQTVVTFSTLQLATDIPVLFNASSSMKQATTKEFEYDLMSVIKQAPIDLVKEDSFHVVFNFSSTSVSSISVNKWVVYDNNGDVGIE